MKEKEKSDSETLYMVISMLFVWQMQDIVPLAKNYNNMIKYWNAFCNKHKL